MQILESFAAIGSVLISVTLIVAVLALVSKVVTIAKEARNNVYHQRQIQLRLDRIIELLEHFEMERKARNVV